MMNIFAIALFTAAPSFAQEFPAARMDSVAPDFTLTDLRGNRHSLNEHRGNYVVLEWVNFDCPFVKKHYESGNMSRLQKTSTGKGAAWFSICSSAPGKQGNLDSKTIQARINNYKARHTAYLIDADGTVGRLYGAKTTPHLFVVDPQGILIYAGAIDDKPSTDKADIATAHNYVVAAMDESMAGNPVSPKVTVSYGCSVKY
ncbi:MAG: redoxin domain-containing protein [Chitinispirillaceae bacterium]|nr:redoxin domain-containing protein [Chitinispirillaceae bacterium]